MATNPVPDRAPDVESQSQHTVYPTQSNTVQPGANSNTKGKNANYPAGNEEKAEVLGVDEDQAIDGVDPVYAAKARVLNRAVQDIGMGRYQWQLFGVIGFGWAMDNMVCLASHTRKGENLTL